MSREQFIGCLAAVLVALSHGLPASAAINVESQVLQPVGSNLTNEDGRILGAMDITVGAGQVLALVYGGEFLGVPGTPGITFDGNLLTEVVRHNPNSARIGVYYYINDTGSEITGDILFGSTGAGGSVLTNNYVLSGVDLDNPIGQTGTATNTADGDITVSLTGLTGGSTVLSVALTNDATPAPTIVPVSGVDVLDGEGHSIAGSDSGAYAAFGRTAIPADGNLDVVYNITGGGFRWGAVAVEFMMGPSAAIPGDADGDGDVDGDDFNAWGGNFPTASGATLAQGDFDGDGDVDGDDFNVWGGNFPYPGPGSSAAAVIPEPASFALIGLGAVALLRRRK